MFPYKEELSVGKMKFAAAGFPPLRRPQGYDLHLFGDLRDTMGGSYLGVGMGSTAAMVFLLGIPEPVVLSGQEEERLTHIKE